MKTGITREQIIAAAATALLFVSLIATGFYYHANTNLKGGLNTEKLKSESLLSEKLALTKDAEKLKADITSWMGKNQQTDLLLSEALNKISGLENSVKALRRENSAIAGLKKEINALAQIRQDLESQLADAVMINKSNEKKMNDMSLELASVNAEMEKIKFVPVNITDNFRVETLRGRKNRLTVNAGRTKKLMVSFEIPESMSKDVKFSIITPEGKVIKSDNKDIAVNIIDDGRYLTASLSPLSGEFEISRRIEMSYTPKQKLESGTYKIEIIHNDKVAGTCQLRLK